MNERILEISNLVRSGLISLRDTDLNQVQYLSLGLALGAGLFIILTLLYKLLWSKNKFKHYYPGQTIPKEFLRGNTTRRLIVLFPKLMLVGSAFFLLLALANPYLPKTKIEERIESRERIDLIDASSSMGWEFKKTGKSAGQIAREGFLKFLKMRKGQNDRTSLQAFADEHYILEDFIVDDEVYRMQAEDAPYVYIHDEHMALPENDLAGEMIDIIAPRDRLKINGDPSTTNFNFALEAVIKYIDANGDKRLKRRALLVETDAAVEEDPIVQFRELKKRHVMIYFLQIEPNLEAERQYFDDKALLFSGVLKKRVQEYGGRFYNVTDPKSLEAAYRDVNKLEKSPSKITRSLLRVFIFQRPLVASVVLMFFSVLTGLIASRWGVDP